MTNPETPPLPPAPTPDGPIAPAGWHLNPTTGQREWWDGNQWAEPPVKTTPKTSRLALFALIAGGAAFLLGLVPVLGLILSVAAIGIGIVALVKKAAPSWMPWVGIGGGALALLAGVIVAAVLASGASNFLPAAGPASPASSTPKPSASASKTPKPTPTPVAEVGSLKNPAPAGTQVVSSLYDGTEYTLTMTVNEWDANGTIGATNQFNEAPAATRQYMLATFTVTNTGDIPVDPSTIEYGVSFLGSDNLAVDSASIVTPVQAYGVGEVYPTATVSFNVAYEVPIGSAGGVWVVRGANDFYVLAG